MKTHIGLLEWCKNAAHGPAVQSDCVNVSASSQYISTSTSDVMSNATALSACHTGMIMGMQWSHQCLTCWPLSCRPQAMQLHLQEHVEMPCPLQVRLRTLCVHLQSALETGLLGPLLHTKRDARVAFCKFVRVSLPQLDISAAWLMEGHHLTGVKALTRLLGCRMD